MGKQPSNKKMKKSQDQKKDETEPGVQVVHESTFLNEDDDDDDNSVSSESDDDELELAGELVRNSDASSSSSDDEEEDSEDDDEKPAASSKQSSDDHKKRTIEPSSQKRPRDQKSKKKRKKKDKDDDDDLENIEFIFCDTHDKYWHGCKALLQNSGILYQKHASTLMDWTLEQVVGTVVSTSQAYSEEDAVFGFATLVDATTIISTTAVSTTKQKSLDREKEDQRQQRVRAMEYLQQYALKECPAEYLPDMTKLLKHSSSSSNKLFVFLHGRMINLPLEIVLVLHEQLWLDWEFNIQQESTTKPSSKSGKKKKKAKAAAATPPLLSDQSDPRIVRWAPCTSSGGGELLYRYYDDELLSQRALVSYTVKSGPKAYSQEEAQWLQVMVLTPGQYWQAIQDLKALVGGGSAP